LQFDSGFITLIKSSFYERITTLRTTVFVAIKSFFGIPARGGGSPGQNIMKLTKTLYKYEKMASPPGVAEALKKLFYAQKTWRKNRYGISTKSYFSCPAI
jgi:hypothetical protein